jgi:hypothetical protein
MSISSPLANSTSDGLRTELSEPGALDKGHVNKTKSTTVVDWQNEANRLAFGWVCNQPISHCMSGKFTDTWTCRAPFDECGHLKYFMCWLVRIVPRDKLDAFDRIQFTAASNEHGWFCGVCSRHTLDRTSVKKCSRCGDVDDWCATRRVLR